MNDTNTETKGQFGEPWSMIPCEDLGGMLQMAMIHTADGTPVCDHYRAGTIKECDERGERIVSCVNLLSGHDLAAVSIVPTAVIEEVKAALKDAIEAIGDHIHPEWTKPQEAALEKLNALKP